MSDQTPAEVVPAEGTNGYDPKRPQKLLDLMATGWAERVEVLPEPGPGAPFRAARRAALAERFTG